MPKTKPYQRPPMEASQALAIARYALLDAIAIDRAEGPSAAINDLLEARAVIDRLRKIYAMPKESQCQP